MHVTHAQAAVLAASPAFLIFFARLRLLAPNDFETHVRILQ
jgi:hypothetical protein